MSATYTIPNPPNPPLKLATFYGKVAFRLTVLTPGTGIRLSSDRSDLESPPPLVGTSGMVITDTDREVQQEWEGELWALGDPNNARIAAIAFDVASNPTNA